MLPKQTQGSERGGCELRGAAAPPRSGRRSSFFSLSLKPGLQSLTLRRACSDRGNYVHAYSAEALALAASGYESLNFDEDSRTHRAVRARAQPARTRRRQDLAALLITLAIGVSLAVISNVMLIVEALLVSAMAWVNDVATWGLPTLPSESVPSEQPDALLSCTAFVGCRLLLTLGAALLTWWEPHAKASGMARIKSNLNGADITGYLTRRVLFAKSVAITLVVSASLPLGRDGPLVHLGACIGSLLSTASGTLEMRSPRALRAWISMGAAAGMAAAFNAPFGGLLYAFEEVASHWSSILTWRSFLCVLAFAVSTRVLMEAPRTFCEDEPPWLVDLGGGGSAASPDAPSMVYQVGCAAIASHAFELELDESAIEMRVRDGSLFFYIVVAALGGAAGALFNLAVNRVNLRRRRWHARFTGALSGWAHFLEVMGLALLTFSVFFWLPAAFECTPLLGGDAHGSASASASSSSSSASSSSASANHDASSVHLNYVRYLCPTGEHNTLASLLHVSHHSALQFLYHHSSMGGAVDGSGIGPVPPLIAALVTCLLCYFALAVLLLGVRLPCDSFVPGMIIGALGGRLVGELLHGAELIHGGERGMFALVGSAGVLSGITRMSLTVSIIIVEITHDVRTLPLIMLSQAVGSSIASLLAEPLEDSMIHLQGLPYLSEEPPSTFEDLTARDVMSPRVETLHEECTVREIVRLLRANGHNGFPVVRRADKTLSGFILRRQLLVLLHDRVWEIPRETHGETGELECSSEENAKKSSQGGANVGPPPSTRHASGEASRRGLTWEVFEKRYVGSHSTWLNELQHASLDLSPEDLARTLDLSDFMDPSPPTVFGLAPLPHVYHLFNTMGVRHLTVVNRRMLVVGIITRKDTIPELVQRRLDVNAQASRYRRGEPSSFSPNSSVGQTPAKELFPVFTPELAGRKASRDALASSTASGAPPNFQALNRWRLARDKVSRSRGAITRLTYVSVLASDNEKDALRILSEIVTTSMRNNHDADIGGMIHYDMATNAILQVIEGEERVVRRLYGTILADHRHRGCVVLKDQRVRAREVTDFGMSLLVSERSQREDTAASSFSQRLPSSQRSSQAAQGRAASGDRFDELGGGALLRLQYSSTLVVEGTEEVREVLTHILHQSVRHNPEAGIGGLLVFHADSRTVSQQMEGSEAAVRDLWTRIQADARHTNVMLTSLTTLGESGARRYGTGSWSMLQMRNQCELDDLSSLASRLRPFGSSDHTAHAAARLATKRIADATALNDLIESENRGASAEWTVAPSPGNSWFRPRRSGTDRQRRFSKEGRTELPKEASNIMIMEELP